MDERHGFWHQLRRPAAPAAGAGAPAPSASPAGDRPPGVSEAAGPGYPAASAVNELAELVADLLEGTGLVPADRLAMARRAAGAGSLAQALLDEGLATGDGVARVIADRHRLPFVDLLAQEIQPEAVEQIALAVLERAVALPYRLDGNTLYVAIADPGNIAAVD